MKTKFIISSFLVALSLFQSQAATTAIVDFGSIVPTSTGVAPNTRIEGTTSLSASSLINTNGVATTWNLSVSGTRGNTNIASSQGTNAWGTDPINANFSNFVSSLGLNTTSFDPGIWRDGLYANNAGNTVFSLTGLLANTTYQISLGVGRGDSDGGYALSIASGKGTFVSGSYFRADTVGEPVQMSSANTTIVTNSGTSRTAIATYMITSNASGEITLNLGSLQYGAVEFMTVSVPEPTTATLSLLGLGALALRRRRNS